MQAWLKKRAKSAIHAGHQLMLTRLHDVLLLQDEEQQPAEKIEAVEARLVSIAAELMLNMQRTAHGCAC